MHTAGQQGATQVRGPAPATGRTIANDNAVVPSVDALRRDSNGDIISPRIIVMVAKFEVARGDSAAQETPANWNVAVKRVSAGAPAALKQWTYTVVVVELLSHSSVLQ